mmetsp:Transcript_17679/g.18326  ORF Transcript_17679/g.18326 Transcript_17679/m.18326 type:complete len:548 (+) Transcript_17679:3-1646(+)
MDVSKVNKLYEIVGNNSKYQVFNTVLLYLTSMICLFTTMNYSLMQTLPFVDVYRGDRRIIHSKKLEYKYCEDEFRIEIDRDETPENWVLDLEMYCSKVDVSFIGTFYTIGSVIGAVLILVGNYIGRRYTWILVLSLFIPAIALLQAENKYCLYLSCVLLGTLQSVFIPLKAVIVSENMNKSFRGFVIPITMTVSIVDSLITYLLYHSFVDWKIPYYFIGGIAIVLIVMIFLFTTESPLYLLKNEEKLLDSLNFIRRFNNKDTPELTKENLEELISNSEVQAENEMELGKEIESKEEVKDKEKKKKRTSLETEGNGSLMNARNRNTQDEDNENDDEVSVLSIVYSEEALNNHRGDLESLHSFNSRVTEVFNSTPYLKKLVAFSIFLSCCSLQYFLVLSEIRSYPKNNYYYLFGLFSLPFYPVCGFFCNKIGRKNTLLIIIFNIIVFNFVNIFLDKDHTPSLVIYSIKKMFVFISQAPSWTMQAEAFSLKTRIYTMTITSLCTLLISVFSSTIYEYFEDYLEWICIGLSAIAFVVMAFFIKDTKNKIMS